jgi:uncharacterized flavoprotein (TIGR03862 family)
VPSPALPEIAVIGAGPAGLMAAEVLARGPVRVTLYDRMPSAGRKLLLAGRGGLNLTHSEELECMLERYGAAAPRLRAAIAAFPPAALRAWSETLGQATFVGSSGRVFPEAFKASPLLRAWLKRLDSAGVRFRPRHRWDGWDDGALIFAVPDGQVKVAADAAVLALGGASWPRLGSDGGWVDVLTEARIGVTPLAPANCGFAAAWSDVFRNRFEGQPLKRVALSFADHTARGEVIITRSGLEGGAVYALSAPLRDGLAAAGEAVLHIDLRPDLTAAALAARLAATRGKQSLSTFLRKTVALAPAAVGLLHEAAITAPERTAPERAAPERLTAMSPAALAALIKAVPVRLTAAADLARAISTAGGIAWDEIDAHFMLRRRPGAFVAGEMLDWEAPTGGYLLQAVFSTGAAAAHGALQWVARDRVSPAGRSPHMLNETDIPAQKDGPS